MKRILLIMALLAIILLTSFTIATNGYNLSWWTVDGGGGTFSTGGDYTLGGTIGQPDAGLLTGGDYTLGGGFWGGGEVHQQAYMVYLPTTMR